MPVRLIKKGPQYNPNMMILHRTPKAGFFEKIRAAITWDVEVWVVKCFFMSRNSMQAGDNFRRDKSNWTFGVVKEKHDSLWVSNYGGFKQLNANCVYMHDVCDYGTGKRNDIPVRNQDVFVIPEPDRTGRWYADRTVWSKNSNNVNRFVNGDFGMLSRPEAQVLCADYNN